MLKKRVIAVILDCEGKVVQSVKFKHTNIVHYDTKYAVDTFSNWSVDEIILLNVSRESGNRDNFLDTLRKVSKNCFIPITAGGWITDKEYADKLLRNGADKLILNTAISDNPKMVSSLVKTYGKQCIVASIDVKRNKKGVASVYVDRARRNLNINPTIWAQQAQALGVGEVFFNSVDHDGARKGYDIETLSNICKSVDIPVIGFGGVFSWDHMYQGIEAGCEAVAVANQFHYQENAALRAKSFLAERKVNVRKEGRLSN
mgnify:FL=1|jgi:imidazole glycerol-phosphate synthase subunit HisF